MTRRQKNNSANTQKTIRLWHRWVGYTSLFFVMILSITGLILNRAEKFNLNQIMVQNDIVSSLYSQPPNASPVHFKAGEQWLSWLEGRIYLDGEFFSQNTSLPVGAATLNDLIIIGTADGLSLYMKDGTLMETIPGKILAIGQPSTDYIIIDTPNGVYRPDNDFITRQKTSETIASSDDLVQPPQQIRQKIIQDFRGQGVTLSRLILDLHSGNIMGPYGSYIMDLAAISLIFLGITGLFKRKKSDRHKRK